MSKQYCQLKKKKFKKSIVEVNKIIKSNDEKFEVIDLYSVFVNENGLMTKELTTDGIHLNEKGYKKWVDFIKPIIYSINN